MTTEYAPGTVVTATVNGRPNVRLVSGWSRYDPQLRWCELSPRWGDGDDEECWHFPSQVSDVRPLVVIDPEDGEQVERLAVAIYRQQHGMIGPVAEDVQSALCALIAPPRPDEPTGLGAVVEDASQVEFIHLGSGLWAYGTTDGPSEGFRYADIDAVRILSPGVDA